MYMVNSIGEAYGTNVKDFYLFNCWEKYVSLKPTKPTTSSKLT